MIFFDEEVRPSGCGAPTRLSAAEYAALSALPEIVEPVVRGVVCELAGSHGGSHVAFAVASHGGDLWWWVCWGRHRHEVVQIDLCDGPQPGRPGSDCCLLPAGHLGLHSFELLPSPAPT